MSENVTIRFVRGTAPYNANEVAGFDPATAKHYVDRGYAEYEKAEKPKDPNGATDTGQGETDPNAQTDGGQQGTQTDGENNPPKDQLPDFSAMSLDELKKYAEANDIKLGNRNHEDTIIEKIKEDLGVVS